ncbi:MAG: glycerol kinase GlpK [Spirochaetes bacterium]|nr:glycerol kinase GlpK [Spirochaetota bacterium]
MADKKYIAAIDQGTTSTRAILFDASGSIVSMAQKEHRQLYPKPGWVEHDANEIRDNTFAVIQDALHAADATGASVAAVGITNQRETTVVWDRNTGKPYANAIIWQDTRTDGICSSIGKKIGEPFIRRKTGLPVATYFSGPKVSWMLRNIPGLGAAAKNGDAVFGTIDAWLVWNLTGGKHITDVTNASRTMLMDLKTLSWDKELLRAMKIPMSMLPEIRPSSDPSFYGYTTKNGPFGAEVPVAGVLGDQQAALFGQACFAKGMAKNTYGTGCFMLMNIGEKPVLSKYGLITTVGYKIGKEKAVYALEGSVAIAGALVQWLRDNLGIITSSAAVEDLAGTVNDSGGIYIVPAFSGLYAPYWRSDARGIIAGLTRYIHKGHIARAAIEATAYQTRELYDAMIKDAKMPIRILKVDGGMVKNELLMQFQSDMLGVPVVRPAVTETTALGAAYAAGIATGFWQDKKSAADNWRAGREWKPVMKKTKRDALMKGWKKAVSKSLGWVD